MIFKKNMSTFMAIKKIIFERITNFMENIKLAVHVFIDFKKAFNTLVTKLDQYANRSIAEMVE